MVTNFFGSRIQDRLVSQDTWDGRQISRAPLRQFGSLKFLQFVLVLLCMSTTTYAIPKVTSLLPKSVTCATPGITGEEAQDMLKKALKTDDDRGVEQAAACGADLDRTMGAYTPLTLAAAYGKTGSLRALIRLGADLEKKSAPWEGAPLHWAAAGKQDLCTAYLLEAGASVRALDKSGRTALHHAAYYGPLSIARRLVHAGAEVNARNADGETPLTMALLDAERNKDMVSFLRSMGGRE